MKFIVSRSTVSFGESKSPCEGAREEELTPLDFRTVKTLEEAQKKVWYKEWLDGGVNHREEDGIVVCDKKEKAKEWVIEVGSLEDLIELQENYGEILLRDSAPYKEARKEIKILGQSVKIVS
jgi:hypothetical protein